MIFCIEARTRRPVFGVVPMLRELRLPDEDSVEFKKRVGRKLGFRHQQSI